MNLYDTLEQPQTNEEKFTELYHRYQVLHQQEKTQLLVGYSDLPETENEYRDQQHLSEITRPVLQEKYELSELEFTHLEEFFTSGGFMRVELLDHTILMYNEEVMNADVPDLETKFLSLITRASFWVDMFYFGSDIGPHISGPNVASEPELLAAVRSLSPKQIARTGFKSMMQVLAAAYKVEH